MKIGLCTPVNCLQVASQIGFDYIEPAVTSIASMEEAEFLRSVEEVNASSIKCEACNALFPSHIRLTGNDTNEEKIRSYLDIAFSRIVQLGTKTVVLGSGGARRIPEGFDRIEGRKQFLHAAGVTGDLAAKYNLTIAIEPLNRNETNLINSVKEGIEFVKELNHPNVKLLADFYHMRMEDEPMAVIEEAGTLLYHVHIAKGHKRTYPLSQEEDTYGQLFEALRNIGYEKGISIEGSTENLAEDGPAALMLLRSLSDSC